MVHTAFPDVYVECAFDTDLSDDLYAQTGWTGITEFVRTLSGNLRGRSYELDQIQTGSMAIDLDNGDGRFTPDSIRSPYYPNVKASRRLRIRGKNMQSLNVGRTGSQDHSASDFFPNPNNVTRYSASDSPVRIQGEAYEASSGGTVIAATRDPEDGGTEVTYIKAGTWLSYIVDLEDRVAASLDIRAASQDGCTVQIRTTSPTGTVIASATVPASHNWTLYRTINLDVSAAALTGQQLLYITFANLNGTYALNLNWLEFKTAEQRVSMPVAVQHDPIALGFTGELAADTEGWHIEATVDPLQPIGKTRVLAWFEPIELGVRLSHSGWVWLVDGTEPANSLVGFVITYYDANRNVIRENGVNWDVPTTGVPERFAYSDLPPANAKYAIGSVTITTTQAYTEALTYAVCGLQAELPDNLAPNISGQADLVGWETDGGKFSQAGVARQETRYVAGLPDDFSLDLWTTGGSPTSTPSTLTLPNGTAGAYSSVLGQARVGTGSGFSVAVSAANDMQAGAEFYANLYIDDDNMISFITSGAEWVCRMRHDGINVDMPINEAHPSLPAWVCIYESAGVVYWLTATDGTDWTVLRSSEHSMDFSEATVQLQSGSYQATTPNPITVTELNTHLPEPGVTISWFFNGSEIGQKIPRLIPGDDYAVVLEAKKDGGPDVLLTATDGFDGVMLTADNTWTTLTYTWTAQHPTDTLKLILQDAADINAPLTVRGINIQHIEPGETPSFGLDSPWASGETDWTHPRPIFDGWVEEWPITTTAGTTELVSVTVDDRMAKLANADLASVIVEELRADDASLILPLTDDPNPGGLVAMLGTWADDSGQSSFAISATRGDIGTGTYELGVPGPIGTDTALKLTPASPTQGYVLLPPWSKDYQWTAAVPAESGPPATLPAGEIVVSKYYATWHGNYAEDNSAFSSDFGFQGDFGSSHGDTKTLYGFNYKAIQHDLAGAEIIAVTFTLENYHWHDGGKSGTAYMSTHNYTSKPSTWSGSRVYERRYTVPNWAAHQYRTIRILPNTVGVEFQNGTTTGLGLGPAGSSDKKYAGEFATSQSGARPMLTITYKRGA